MTRAPTKDKNPTNPRGLMGLWEGGGAVGY